MGKGIGWCRGRAQGVKRGNIKDGEKRSVGG